MKKLLIRADDIGYSKGVTLGILDAAKFGLVKSAAFMINMPFAKEAVALAKKQPDLCLGLHINFTNGCALANKELISELVDEDGVFISSKVRRRQIKEGKKLFSIDQAYIEAKAQVDRYIEYMGCLPEYIDAHVLEVPEMIAVIQKVKEEYHIPHSYYDYQLNELQHKQTMSHYDFYQNHHQDFVDYFKNDFQFQDFNIIVTHPAYIDYQLKMTSSLIDNRLYDFALTTDRAVKDYLRNQNIKIISFRDL